MTTRIYYVLFDRDENDEAVGAGAPVLDHYTQLCCELEPAWEASTHTLVCSHRGTSDRLMLVVLVEHDGDTASLARRLQAAYDDDGVDGYFQIIGEV